MKRVLWLDDIRDPKQQVWNNWIARNVGNPLHMNIHWVLKYHQFIDWIETNGLPDMICFDHDLSDIHINKSTYKEKTGYDCAKWLVEYCIENNQKLPEYFIQSANPIGAENIDKYLKNFQKHFAD